MNTLYLEAKSMDSFCFVHKSANMYGNIYLEVPRRQGEPPNRGIFRLVSPNISNTCMYTGRPKFLPDQLIAHAATIT